MSSTLEIPFVYEASQWIVGSEKQRAIMVADYLRPQRGNRILDLGCGPAGIVSHLAPLGISYEGVDGNGDYIQHAEQHAKSRDGKNSQFHFWTANVEDACARIEPDRYDIIMAFSLFHHLNNVQIVELLKSAKRGLKSGGRLVTLDPCRFNNMNLIEKFLVTFDRGEYIRDEQGYESLVSREFPKYSKSIRKGMSRFPARAIVFEALNTK